MKILVFGKTGQVATELQARAEVIALGRDRADLSDPAACARAIHAHAPEVVINAAAYTAVDKAETEEHRATIINGDAPGAMAQGCATRGIPFLHVSTDYVFDGTGTAPWRPSDPVAPLGAYGRSKLAGERAVTAAGGQWAILRTSWVFSAHGSNFVKTMLRLSETRDTLRVVDDQVGGPTPAGAIAEALLTMARAMVAGQGGGLYHFAGAPDTSWARFARETFAHAGRNVTVTGIPTEDYPTPADRPRNSRLDCRDMKTDFGISRPDWKPALAEIVKEVTA
ncbi:dTDP-4-dehydrorhamnose reductase [Lutimaribacter sp. EGI FJ00015]|uniref:dTDP-4-dehydrorhamnose reductase n=1 Tax=Lutimaribacter degradans TaxID=2945989 RepID=A0ACC5ZZT8_9RHOB|nr:dTDP-4-dehydrorhamnose reductase [Lutimaribacter sp. EGI FJ00013]MCM2563857.1 dTDP-4-dehydrorhamnose reductase [Lutimaribacter sp. EGI FJ00013]MCO0615044.1 dTDP-4-dehydrorhamnose reductase [Lutimaribacter sp. EGI FJ00015]MCO0637716.1 dTDP-4-dehydrorhamnose reductase [Lutimaribacter sp. EGI FJ00014]